MGKQVKARKRGPRVKPKGIFCIEGSWTGRIDQPMSVRPALELLHQWHPFNIPFVHRDVITRAEFEAYLSKWCQKSAQKRYPILYLAFHGQQETLYIGDNRKKENTVSLDEIEDLLAGRCDQRIIHFGGCGVIDTNGNRLNRFLRNTEALAVCGYREDVLWLDSIAFEMLIFGAMQLNTLTRSGARAMQRRIEGEGGGLARRLGFRMVVAK